MKKRIVTIGFVFWLVLQLVFVSAFVTDAQDNISLHVKRAVVRIVPERCFAAGCQPLDDQPGSGVIIHPSGLVLTAWHVVSKSTNPRVEDYWDDFFIETANVR